VGRPSQSARYSCLDLFSGAGGLTLGLDAAGFSCVGAIEVDEVASKTYVENFGERSVALFGPVAGDIREADPSAVRRGLAASGITELDLLAAAPPCQGFVRPSAVLYPPISRKLDWPSSSTLDWPGDCSPQPPAATIRTTRMTASPLLV